jgi:hypothetical protein
MFAFMPASLLRAEGAILFLVATTMYWNVDGSWLVFALAFFLPDLAMMGYLRGNQVGAAAYNAVHSSVVPGILAMIGIAMERDAAIAISLIWLAHIGFDHAIGYGLKYADGFKETHLGRV